MDIVTIRSGQVDPRLLPYRGMPLIAPDHIESGTGHLLEVRTAEQQGAISGKYLVDPGDIIYSKIRPNLQKAYLAEFPALCSADMYPLKPRPGIDGNFVLNTLLGRDFTIFATGVSMRSGIPKINRTELAEYELPVPPFEEQQAIGRALANADGLLISLERLIAKKREIKQGMMQELLTGRTRLPGFSKGWSRTSLGAVSAFITKGATPTTYGFKWESSGIPFLRSECVSEHGLDMTQSMFISNLANQALRRSQVSDGDILMTITGYVGRVIRLADVGVANINQHIARVHIKDPGFDPGFAYHFLSLPAMRTYYESIVTGQAYPQISLVQVRDTEIPAPSIEEQRAIGAALSDADTELETLERRLESARAVKTGMIQELLTGRTRLPVEVAV